MLVIVTVTDQALVIVSFSWCGVVAWVGQLLKVVGI